MPWPTIWKKPEARQASSTAPAIARRARSSPEYQPSMSMTGTSSLISTPCLRPQSPSSTRQILSRFAHVDTAEVPTVDDPFAADEQVAHQTIGPEHEAV